MALLQRLLLLGLLALPTNSLMETDRPEALLGTSTSISVTENGGRRMSAASTMAQELFDAWTIEYAVEEKCRRNLSRSQGLAMPGTLLDATRHRKSPLDQPSFNDAAAGAGAARRRLAGRLFEPGSLPPAPHIQCCDELTRRREEQDSRGPSGEMPGWAAPVAGNDGTVYPRPPWIRGLPRDNLPLTHQAQADIWAHQFPADSCRKESTRFLISWWDRPNVHGLGSQLHLMAEMLGMAIESGRVLVFLPKSFDRAKHSGCQGASYKSLACYFFPPFPSECQERAVAALNATTPNGHLWHLYPNQKRARRMTPGVFQAIHGPEPVVVVSARWGAIISNIPRRWGQPWLKSDMRKVLGRGISMTRAAQRLEVNWWRSQAVRFFMRWPSAYLCHLLNFARHQTYGLEAAATVLKGMRRRLRESGPGHSLVHSLVHSPGHSPGHTPGLRRTQRRLWEKEAVPGSGQPNANASSSFVDGARDSNVQPLQVRHCASPSEGEPFLPGPIIRVHVRGSDKVIEMKLLRFEEYLSAADALRGTALPRATRLWLSSEEKEVFRKAENVTRWKVYKLEMERKIEKGMVRKDDQWRFAMRYGLRDYVEASLINLLISQQCNGFLFTLKSNWERIANMLRVTSGRLHHPFIALNQGEVWSSYPSV